MFAEFGQAPLCLELDLDSYEGPWQHIARFRRGSGWLIVVKCTIQSEHDILTAKLVAACDEYEHAIPAFQAAHLTECDWINPTYCDELPPDILEDLICEEEGALIARWHREKNIALAEAFEDQEARIAELEGRVQSIIARNERQIGELRQRRRHPDATPDMRRAMGQIIRELDDENDELLTEMAETRSAIREQADQFEEALWSREDLLIEVTPLHIVRWSAQSCSYPDVPALRKQYATDWMPACGRTGGSSPEVARVLGASVEKQHDKSPAITEPIDHDEPEVELVPQPMPQTHWDLRERKLYGKLAKALDRADRLASIIERSHHDDRHLPYNEKQHRKALSDVQELESQIAQLPRMSAADASSEERQEIAGRSAEDKLTERRERSELDREHSELLSKWVEIAAVQAENQESSYEAKLAGSAFRVLKLSLDENEERRKEIDRNRALEETLTHSEQPFIAGGEASSEASSEVREVGLESARPQLDPPCNTDQTLQRPVDDKIATEPSMSDDQTRPPQSVQNALSALSAARRRYYGHD